ncbi:MAG: hypothetical protein K2O41_06180 [Clostridia bacterium]|nr:hypothetical protein [Clostridia bacterium]
METYVTIKMTENEYADYVERQATLEKDHVKIEAILHDSEKLAQMVEKEMNRISDGARIGGHAAQLLYTKAQELLIKLDTVSKL